MEAIYGAPNPPDILFGKGVLHPHTLDEETTDIIRGILLTAVAPLSIFEVYQALVDRGNMTFDPDCVSFREHPTIKAIAGACQYLHFSGQLK